MLNLPLEPAHGARLLAEAVLRARALGGPGSGNFGHSGGVGGPGKPGGSTSRGNRISDLIISSGVGSDYVHAKDWRRLRDEIRDLGGPGSGNFGHVGRPGQVGGSAKSLSDLAKDVTELKGQMNEMLARDPSADFTEIKSKIETATDLYRRAREKQEEHEHVAELRKREFQIQTVERRARDVAEEMGVDPSMIRVVYKDPTSFTVGNQQFQEAGHYDSKDGTIEINALNAYDQRMSVTRGLVAHEVFHAQFDAVLKAQAAEHKTIRDMPDDEFNRLFKRNGYPRPESLPELRERFPASSAFSETWGDPYLDDSHKMDSMIKENGHTPYAKAYWSPELQPGNVRQRIQEEISLRRAMNETMAEISRWFVAPESWVGPKPSADSSWVKLTKSIQQVYPKIKGQRLKAALEFFQ